MSSSLFDRDEVKAMNRWFIWWKSLWYFRQPTWPILKWIWSKYKHAKHILPYLPQNYNTFIEPFLGSWAILWHVAPKKWIAWDIMHPLIDFWNYLKNNPEELLLHYKRNISYQDKKVNYEAIKANFNEKPNWLDMLMLSRLCYWWIIRFTKNGKMSTPVWPHEPISADTFEKRLRDRNARIKNTDFYNKDFEEIIEMAWDWDLVYCDPPYVDSQTIIYWAQAFNLMRLLVCLKKAKDRWAFIMLSIDWKKRSWKHNIEIDSIDWLFNREVFIDCGISMLNRLQRDWLTMEWEQVHDRLLLSR